MTRDDIIRMAGHREVPPWVMKLVMDCVEAEREQCVDVAMKLMEDKTGEHPEYYRGIVVAAAAILTKEHQ